MPRTPLVVAPYKRDPDDEGPTRYALFEYCEEKEGDAPTLVRSQLDSVPDHLASYRVAYTVCGDEAESMDHIQRRLSISSLPVHLRNLVVIDSTHSGLHKSSSYYFSILLPLLKAFGLAHVYVATTSPRTISNNARSFSSSSTVVLLAGDTSVHEFINSLTPSSEQLRLNVAVIPTGTGNGLSASIGHQDVAHAISRLFVGTAVPLPTCRVDFPEGSEFAANCEPVETLKFAVVLSWGFHAALVADSDTPQYRSHGPARFGMAAQANIEKDQNYHGQISFNSHGAPVSLGPEHSYVLFTLVSKLEKTFCISPATTGPAQELHLVQFRHLPGPEIMEIMHKVYDDSKHVSDPRVTYAALDPVRSHEVFVRPIATIAITETNPANCRWCVDGRIVKVPAASKEPICIYSPSSYCNGWFLYIVI